MLGLGALAYVLTKGRVGSKQVQQLAEHIEFTEAKTIEEARAFAKEHLGIRHYELTNLDIANYVNEGLVSLSNSVKGSTMFRQIKKLPDGHFGRMSCTSDGKILSVNESEILESMKLENLQEMFKQVSAKQNLSHFDLSSNQIELINKFKKTPEKLTFNEKMEFEELIQQIQFAPENLVRRYIEALQNNTILNVMKCKNSIIAPNNFIKLTQEEQAKYVEELFNAGYKQPVYSRGKFVYINHEFGHKLHAENIGRKQFEKISVDVHNNDIDAIKKYALEFQKRNPEMYPLLREVSYYAPFSEAEAVAEIFAGLKNGVKYNDKVMALFEEWGGVVPA